MRSSEVTLELVLAAFLSLQAGEDPENIVRSLEGWSRIVRLNAIRPTNHRAPVFVEVSDDSQMNSTSDYYELRESVPESSLYPHG